MFAAVTIYDCPTPDEVEQKSTGNWYSNMVTQSDLESKQYIENRPNRKFKHFPLFAIVCTILKKYYSLESVINVGKHHQFDRKA